MKRLAILAALAVANVAHANVWDDAIKIGVPDPAQDEFDTKMRQGDEHTALANAQASTSLREIRNQLQLAIESYRAAAAAKPKEAEPYFRIGRVLYSFYFECDDTAQRFNRSLLCDRRPAAFNRPRAEEVIAAWDAFEERAPLDPRLSASAFGDTEILFRRAILHTKLATKEHLTAAALDYEKILAREDTSDGPGETVIGNLAETYMMIGRLEESIEMYREALRAAATTSTWYGYAVALDRDERTDQAIDVINSLGRSQRDDFHAKVIANIVFFVPEGEKFYYFALVEEAFGNDDDAITYWRQYISSGAHPQYQPRARAHLDGLLKKKRFRTPLPIEPPWRGILR